MNIVERRIILNQEIEVYGNVMNPLFNADEVAKLLENKNVSQMLKNVDNDEKKKIEVKRENNTSHMQWFLTEDGLYEVFMLSRKPIAKEFKKRIKSLLRELRYRNMIYMERTNVMKLNNKIRELEEFINSNNDYISITTLSAKYDMRVKEFVHLLNENRILYKKGKLYYLYSPYKYKGYVKYLKENGKMVMKFTLKGEKFIEDYCNKER